MSKSFAAEHLATDEVACLDGHLAPAAQTAVSAVDPGFLRGDGVFEVVRVYRGRPFALQEHLDRLTRSAANLRLSYEVPRRDLLADIERVLGERAAGDYDGCLRIVLTRGGRRLVLTEPRGDKPELARLAFVTYAPTRVLDGVKSLSYAANMLATRIAEERGFDDALLITPHGRVLEAPTASVFWVAADGSLATPPLSEHILASITRDRIMRLISAVERSVTRDELLAAREVFLTSTTREVQPVAEIETQRFDAPGPRTREAASALRRHIETSAD